MPRPTRRQTLSLGLGAGLAAGLAAPADAGAIEPTFTLLLVNDVYLMSEVEGRGGFARLNAVVRAERARGVPMLYAHAGDTLSPSLMSGFDRGAHIVELLNIAPPDIFVPGNHEFDFGPTTFAQRMGEAAFPVFAANLRAADGKPLAGLRDRMIVTLGGIRVGLVGIALASTPEKSQSGDLVFGPEIETLRAAAQALRDEGADLIVGVCHTARVTDEAIVAARIVDILLSGHDHDLIVQYDGRSLLAESSFDARYVTAIDVAVTVMGTGKARTLSWHPTFRIHDTADVTPDPETLALTQRLEARLAKELDVPVGTISTPLDSRISTVRLREGSFGNLVGDALRAATGAEIAVTNGGGIRGNRLYPAGTVLTRRDILTELPFGNTTILVSLTGAQVRALLESALADLGRPAGRFPQVSGLVVTVDPGANAGHRILSILVDGQPLDETRAYTVASNNFLYDGGNGYGLLADGRTLIGATDGKLVANEVMAYIARHDPLSVPDGGPDRDPVTAPGPLSLALDEFRASGSSWLTLPFFSNGAADAVCARVDERIAEGASVLPSPDAIFRALTLTPLEAVKAVILGQDPYPTPGDANGLAFSYVGPRRLPASLKVILAELPGATVSGDLTPWARRGVLLLNSALTVEAGKSGAHLRYGWSALTDDAVKAVSARSTPAIFLLWGAQARARAALIDRERCGVIETGHPSPLNRLRDFAGTRPFDEANAWLAGRGLSPIDWSLD